MPSTERPDSAGDFWELPELVERFAARDPDLRLLDLIQRYDDPATTRVLDLGCAGGRNTVVLAERGFDVHAVDRSRAMVARTRARLTPILGGERAAARVVVGHMDDLSRFADGSFALLLGLGIYHQADSETEWERAVAESARVLEADGLLLYASFHPETAPEGEPGRPVPGEPGMYSGFRTGKVYLIGPGELERRLATHGLEPVSPTTVARVRTGNGERVTVNGLFRRVPE